MVSSSQQHERIRKRKATTNGKANKRERRALGTPAFSIHPEGYDVNAPDAKKPVAKKAAAPVKKAKPAKKAATKRPAKKAADKK
jgi:hypothetical protein